MARRANSLAVLVNQVNTLYPNRNKASDGWLGDAAHQATKSEHNPNSAGVVTAQDITHDPAHGADMNALKEHLIKDSRTWYVIWNRRIWEGGWKAYNGANPHDKHLHISTKQSASVYDNGGQWNLGGTIDNMDKIRAKWIGDIFKGLTGKDISQKDLDFYLSRPNGEIDMIYSLLPSIQKYRDVIQLLENDRDKNQYPKINAATDGLKLTTAASAKDIAAAIEKLKASGVTKEKALEYVVNNLG